MKVGFGFEFTLLAEPENPQVECLVERGLRELRVLLTPDRSKGKTLLEEHNLNPYRIPTNKV